MLSPITPYRAHAQLNALYSSLYQLDYIKFKHFTAHGTTRCNMQQCSAHGHVKRLKAKRGMFFDILKFCDTCNLCRQTEWLIRIGCREPLLSIYLVQ